LLSLPVHGQADNRFRLFGILRSDVRQLRQAKDVQGSFAAFRVVGAGQFLGQGVEGLRNHRPQPVDARPPGIGSASVQRGLKYRVVHPPLGDGIAGQVQRFGRFFVRLARGQQLDGSLLLFAQFTSRLPIAFGVLLQRDFLACSEECLPVCIIRPPPGPAPECRPGSVRATSARRR
jgi:hypothetical protein